MVMFRRCKRGFVEQGGACAGHDMMNDDRKKHSRHGIGSAPFLERMSETGGSDVRTRRLGSGPTFLSVYLL